MADAPARPADGGFLPPEVRKRRRRGWIIFLVVLLLGAVAAGTAYWYAEGRFTQTPEVVGLAADGEEAVELARSQQPDVVLLDLAMPRMDGLQALPLILEAVPGVRVVVLSGFDKHTMADRALEAGAHRYVEKGLSTKELSHVVAEVLAS